jgi:DNA helicase-2/ATP-dependent DNA helicase PcrA
MSKQLDGLNPQQREAVCTVNGPVLVLAGAGSGKTRVITQRIAYLIASGAATAENILAMTFTNKAAAEMRERVGKLVGKKIAAGLTISTFHSFCLNVLREHIERLGYRKNFTISGEGDTRTLLRRVLHDFDGHNEAFDPSIFVTEISLMKAMDSAGTKFGMPSSGNENQDKYRTWLPEVYERYQSALRAANTLDFDDLLTLTLKLWRDHPDVLNEYRTRYRFVMVDEYQDTNRVQYELLRALVREHRNFCVVGDDDQSIYGWRGADVRNILDFERDFPEAKIVTLAQNYRSTETILNAANSVIANNGNRRPKELWSQLGKGRAIDWIITSDEDHEAKMVVSWMEFIQSKSNAHHKDFAVLYRSNLQSRPIEILLRQAGVPYTVIGGTEFFERAEVKDIIAYLRVLVNPYDETAFLRIINVPRRGIGDTALHAIHEICQKEKVPFGKAMTLALDRGLVSQQAEAGITVLRGVLNDFRARVKAREPLQKLVTDLVEAIDYRDEVNRMCKTPEQAMQRWGNVEAVFRAVAEYEAKADKTAQAGKPPLQHFLTESALNTDEDRRSKRKERQDAVTLMTIHSAKGLEYPFVFIVGAEEGLLPHDRSLKENSLEEERRLFYVALTRGKRHVTLFEALSRTRFGKARPTKTSRFLAEIPEALIKKSVLATREMVEATLAPPKPKKKRRAPRKPFSQ